MHAHRGLFGHHRQLVVVVLDAPGANLPMHATGHHAHRAMRGLHQAGYRLWKSRMQCSAAVRGSGDGHVTALARAREAGGGK